MATLISLIACNRWGAWVPWAWPHDGLQRNRDAVSGRMLSQLYADEGLNMLDKPASFSDEKLENAVEPRVKGWVMVRPRTAS